MKAAGAGLAGAAPPLRAPFVVLGTSFLDIRAVPRSPQRPCAHGEVTVCPGGPGRNLADNLARLGSGVTLVSAVGGDLAGQMLLELTRKAGVDTRGVRMCEGHPTGCFSAIMSPRGTVQSAVVQGTIREAVTAEHISENCREILSAAGGIVMELALPAATLETARGIAASRGVPFCLEAASGGQSERCRRLVEGADLVKGNFREMLALSGVSGDGPDAAPAVLGRLLEMGAKSALVTMGSHGAMVASGRSALRLRHPAAAPVDTAGAGDSFLAAVLHAGALGRPWPAALRWGASAARRALMSPLSCPPDLTAAILDEGARHATVEAVAL